MDYYLKRGRWCVRTMAGGIVKFSTEEEAKDYVSPKNDPFEKKEVELDEQDFWKDENKDQNARDK